MDLLKQNQDGHVLLVYDSSSKDELQDFGKHLQNKTFLSNADLSTEQKPCSCSIILLQVSDKTISDTVAKQLFKLSNPGTTLIVHKLNEQAVDDAEFILKTNGFISVKVRNESNVLSVIGKKPNYEIGSTAKLSFKKSAAAVWRLDDDDDDGVETVDPDNLLDEDDLKKPEPSSLRVCGTTGKRKACKDCSCGLAEELSADAANVIDTGNAPKSSCGSCYLGDAFRCASCPYLGMPAFRPGEKIQLKDNLLNDDI